MSASKKDDNMIKIMPDEVLLNQWVQDFTFDYDVFYLAEENTEFFTGHLKDVTILTKNNFSNV